MTCKETKIIDLAHTLLHGHTKKRPHTTLERGTQQPDSTPPHSTVLDTFLQRAKTTAKMIANSRPANRYECVEIEALIFYTARESKIEETALRGKICADLKIESLNDLSLEDYTKIRDYLWEEAQETA